MTVPLIMGLSRGRLANRPSYNCSKIVKGTVVAKDLHVQTLDLSFSVESWPQPIRLL